MGGEAEVADVVAAVQKVQANVGELAAVRAT
jgi:hypothetical protein